MELEPYGDTSCGDCSLRGHHTQAECEARQALDLYLKEAGEDLIGRPLTYDEVARGPDPTSAELPCQHELGYNEQTGECVVCGRYQCGYCERGREDCQCMEGVPDWDAIEAETKRQHEAGIHKQCDQMDCYTCWWEQTPKPTRVAADGEWPKRHVVRPGPVVNERYDATATYVLECGHTMGAWG